MLKSSVSCWTSVHGSFRFFDELEFYCNRIYMFREHLWKKEGCKIAPFYWIQFRPSRNIKSLWRKITRWKLVFTVHELSDIEIITLNDLGAKKYAHPKPCACSSWTQNIRTQCIDIFADSWSHCSTGHKRNMESNLRCRVPEWPTVKSWHFPWHKGQRPAYLQDFP